MTRCWKYTFPVFLLCLFYHLLFSKSVKRVSRILGIFAFTFVSLCVFVMLRSHHNFGYSSISAARMETSTSSLNICKSLVFTCFLAIDYYWLSLIITAWPEHLLEKWPCKSPRLQLTASSRRLRMIDHLKDQFHENILCFALLKVYVVMVRGLNKEGVSGKLWVVIANWKSIHNQYSIIFQFLHDKLFWQKITFL